MKTVSAADALPPIESPMFERYTEKARRIIFYAREEASQYGSRSIETEHLLLGLLREDRALFKLLLPQGDFGESIRKDIEAGTTAREPISGSVEVPLATECKRILINAAEEADQLAHRRIGTEHLLLGILREENCRAARLLQARGAHLVSVRDALARHSAGHHAQSRAERAAEALHPLGAQAGDVAQVLALSKLIDAWKARDAKSFSSFFKDESQFVNLRGETWLGPVDIAKGAASYFSSWSPLEGTEKILEVNFVAPSAVALTIRWTAAAVSEQPEPREHQMTLALVGDADRWSVMRAQVTELQPASAADRG